VRDMLFAVMSWQETRTTTEAGLRQLSAHDDEEDDTDSEADACPFDDADADVDDGADDSVLDPSHLLAQLTSTSLEPARAFGNSNNAAKRAEENPAEDLDADLAHFDFAAPDIKNYGRSKRVRRENKWLQAAVEALSDDAERFRDFFDLLAQCHAKLFTDPSNYVTCCSPRRGA
jgi:hypothetical protein